MKLGVQEVRTALRRTQTGLAGLVARVRAFVGLAYVSSLRALNLFLFPFLSAEAYEVFSKSTVDARMRGVCASPDVRGATITTIFTKLTVELLFLYAIITKDPTVATLHDCFYVYWQQILRRRGRVIAWRSQVLRTP